MNPATQPRLTTGARILRGSWRIGVLLGFLIFGVSTTIGLLTSYHNAGWQADYIRQSKCILEKRSSTLVTDAYAKDETRYLFEDNGCPGRHYAATEKELRQYAAKPQITATQLMMKDAPEYAFYSALIGALAFVFCWGCGWVVAGFTAD